MAQVEEVTRLQEKVVAGLAEVKDAEKMAAAQKARPARAKARTSNWRTRRIWSNCPRKANRPCGRR